jgi:hypothetical protein
MMLFCERIGPVDIEPEHLLTSAGVSWRGLEG